MGRCWGRFYTGYYPLWEANPCGIRWFNDLAFLPLQRSYVDWELNIEATRTACMFVNKLLRLQVLVQIRPRHTRRGSDGNLCGGQQRQHVLEFYRVRPL